ncbi:hypothetical protein JCM5350_005129 [Sporobolomyces pararoseus]
MPPSYENLHLSTARRATFHKNRKGASTKPLNWPYPLTAAESKRSTVHPDHLAAVGFYSIPEEEDPTRTKCFSCQVEVAQWEEGEDPLFRHLEAVKEDDEIDGCPWATILQVSWAHEGGLEGKTREEWEGCWGEKGELHPRGEIMERARRGTFEHGWPHHGKKKMPTAEDIAGAGWYFSPNPLEEDSDVVCCPYCARTVGGWEEGDDPVETHNTKVGKKCPFFLAPLPGSSKSTSKSKKGKASTAPSSSSTSTKASKSKRKVAPATVDETSEEQDREAEVEEEPQSQPQPRTRATRSASVSTVVTAPAPVRQPRRAKATPAPSEDESEAPVAAPVLKKSTRARTTTASASASATAPKSTKSRKAEIDVDVDVDVQVIAPPPPPLTTSSKSSKKSTVPSSSKSSSSSKSKSSKKIVSPSITEANVEEADAEEEEEEIEERESVVEEKKKTTKQQFATVLPAEESITDLAMIANAAYELQPSSTEEVEMKKPAKKSKSKKSKASVASSTSSKASKGKNKVDKNEEVVEEAQDKMETQQDSLVEAVNVKKIPTPPISQAQPPAAATSTSSQSATTTGRQIRSLPSKVNPSKSPSSTSLSSKAAAPQSPQEPIPPVPTVSLASPITSSTSDSTSQALLVPFPTSPSTNHNPFASERILELLPPPTAEEMSILTVGEWYARVCQRVQQVSKAEHDQHHRALVERLEQGREKLEAMGREAKLREEAEDRAIEEKRKSKKKQLQASVRKQQSSARKAVR